MKAYVVTLSALMALGLAIPLQAQQHFESAETAAQALIDAAANHDSARLAAIVGPQGNTILSSGNVAQDNADQAEFARLARAKHQLIPDARNSNRMILSIGDEDWPFPIPIVHSNGQWNFDASETPAEMRARRIGADELDAIEICAGYVEAQQEYASEKRDKDGILKYAAHMLSADGRDALYQEGTKDPLIPRALADATWDAEKKATKPYHGYFFRILDGQGAHAVGGTHNYRVKGKLLGGFGLVAWPAEYGVTGIYTYMVNQDGVIYQKDIPPASGGAASPVTQYDPDPSWTAVD